MKLEINALNVRRNLLEPVIEATRRPCCVSTFYLGQHPGHFAVDGPVHYPTVRAVGAHAVRWRSTLLVNVVDVCADRQVCGVAQVCAGGCTRRLDRSAPSV